MNESITNALERLSRNSYTADFGGNEARQADIDTLALALAPASTPSMPPLPLPCPFCGSQPVIEPWHGIGPEKHMVSCADDECGPWPKVTGETRAEAIAAWNRRTPPPSAPEAQPAPVDAATVERVAGAVVAWASLPAEAEQVAELRDVVTSALAAQQGEQPCNRNCDCAGDCKMQGGGDHG